jgi:hypothetical protein
MLASHDTELYLYISDQVIALYQDISYAGKSEDLRS